MARRRIGSICKNKDGNGMYMKISSQESIILHPGVFLNIETKKSQTESLQEGLAKGRLTPEFAEKELARIDQIPDWVMGEVFMKVESK